MNRPFLAAGIALVLAAPAWRTGLAPRWLQRVPPGWSWNSAYIGIQTYADPRTGRLPDHDGVGKYQRQVVVVSDSDRPDAVVLEDSYLVHNLLTGKLTYEYVTRERVSPATGALLDPIVPGEVALFPRFVKKTTYRFRSNYLKSIPLAFEREEEVVGLDTYVFSYVGPGEYTESYEGTAEFEGVRPPPGQEIRCADDQFEYRAWVEPVSGEIVKLAEACLSGSYFYEIATGLPLRALDRWEGVTAGDDLVRLAGDARRSRLKCLWAAQYLHGSFLVAGLLSLGAGLAKRRGVGA